MSSLWIVSISAPSSAMQRAARSINASKSSSSRATAIPKLAVGLMLGTRRHVLECGAGFFGQRVRSDSLPRWKQHCEFLAAEAGDDRIPRSFLLENVGESSDDFIAADVSEAVVDRLEVIEVAQDHRNRCAGGLPRQRVERPEFKTPAIEQARQHVDLHRINGRIFRESEVQALPPR